MKKLPGCCAVWWRRNLYCISANYGNESLALIQYAALQGWSEVWVVSVDTGFADPVWIQRVAAVEAYATSLGFKVVRLKARPDFIKLMEAQREFPTPVFQWCAVYLKGDTMRAWLEEMDPFKTTTVLLAGPAETVILENEDAFLGRRILQPLYAHQEEELKALVKLTGLPWLPHRSLECHPCVNSSLHELEMASDFIKMRLNKLEERVGDVLVKSDGQIKKRGCHSPYGCGL